MERSVLYIRLEMPVTLIDTKKLFEFPIPVQPRIILRSHDLIYGLYPPLPENMIECDRILLLCTGEISEEKKKESKGMEVLHAWIN